MAKKLKRSVRGRRHSENSSRLNSTPQRKSKTSAPPVGARQRGRPRKAQLVVSEKVVIAPKVEGSNRHAIASDDLQSRIRELAKLAKEQGYVTFDDLYALGDDRVLAIEAGGFRVAVACEAGYPFAQVFAPPDAGFVCLEPMTAPTNALGTGAAALVAPGDSFTARFSIVVS